jgi:hypothetical protein
MIKVGIFVSKIDDIARQYLAEQVSSEFQFMDQSWYSSWESKYLLLVAFRFKYKIHINC